MEELTRNVIKILSITTIFILMLFALYRAGWVFGWIAAAVLITTLLSPVADFFQKYSPKKSRGFAVFVTFVAMIIVLAAFALIILPPIVSEVVNLGNAIAKWIADAQASGQIETVSLDLKGNFTGVESVNVFDLVKQFYVWVSSFLGGMFSSVSSGIFAFITIVTLTFFMLLDTDSVVRGISYYLPEKRQPMFRKLSNELFTLISKYFAGVLFVGLIAGLAAIVPLLFFNVKYAVALALAVAIFDLIPMVGATLGGAIVVIFCLISGNISAAIGMTVYFVVYQQIENNLVIPLVQKQAIKISPMGILIALLIGGALGGIIGTLLAIPGAAFIKIVFQTLRSEGVLGERAQHASEM